MHYLDIIILVIVVVSAVEGAIQGFIYEVCSLLGLVAGFFLAIQFAAQVAVYLEFIPLSAWILKVIAFLLILVVVNIILRLVGKGLRAVAKTIFMGWLDRVLGTLFGLLRGAAITVFILVILLLTPLGRVLADEAHETQLMAPAIELAIPFVEIFTGDDTPSMDVI